MKRTITTAIPYSSEFAQKAFEIIQSEFSDLYDLEWFIITLENRCLLFWNDELYSSPGEISLN